MQLVAQASLAREESREPCIGETSQDGQRELAENITVQKMGTRPD